MVDGAENNPPSFYLSRHYEVCKYYSLDEHTVLPDILVVGTTLWERLNDQEKEWVQQAADRSVVHQRKLWAISEAEALAEVEKQGVTIIRPDKTLFFEKVKSIYELYKDDKEMHALIQKIQETN